MPYHLRRTCIDWHYGEATPALQAVLRRANQGLSSRDLTAQAFAEGLRKLAAERPDLIAEALVEDRSRVYRIYRARGGAVAAAEVDERPEGALGQAVALPYRAMATVTLAREGDEIRAILEGESHFDGGEDEAFDLPVDYDDEDAMRFILERVSRAIDEGDHRFVAEAAIAGGTTARFLVALRPGEVSVHKLVTMTEPALVARLLRRNFVEVPPPVPEDGEGEGEEA
ncbi:hypothetical protein [Chondromyces apiculatus]|uniref:Uncharacterized protein n=1 Tax=Chondromyces apiculatus DSM 436 TaxID=1192034 RepID=A0A017TB60_9BACT|nr:hypothetical protein [Chondromyces apiculatus]EYF06142.1 Hypothetical protein CAP_2332 [Chondromyces apiculatus DSM 436]